MHNHTKSDKRAHKDRRTKATSPLSLHSLFGSRKKVRRQADRSIHYYIDRYSLRAILTVNVTLILSVADAFLTLRLVSLGAKEINPVMDFFLEYGPLTFLFVKYVLTGISVIWLLIYKNYCLFGKVSVKNILIAIPIIYALVVIYELFLILQIK